MSKNAEAKDESATKQSTVSSRVETVVSWVACKDAEPNGVSNSYLVYRPSAPSDSKVVTLFYDPYHNGWSGEYKVTHWAEKPTAPEYN